jgi:hypothetical protein
MYCITPYIYKVKCKEQAKNARLASKKNATLAALKDKINEGLLVSQNMIAHDLDCIFMEYGRNS